MTSSYQYFYETNVPESELIISRTDLSGKITYANDVFANISAYTVDELIGKPHSIVRHQDMPKSVFKNLWDTLKKGENWSGYVKNLRKDGGYYWVFAQVSGVYKDEILVEFKSLRSPVSEELRVYYQDKYDELRRTEENISRLVTTVSTKNLEKLEKFAEQSNVDKSQVLDKILDDYLL